VTGAQARMGVAVSGGGFRATAFGLGCLRALQDTGLLASVSVISGISGGSLLAAGSKVP
jgi:NTE family protein